MARSAVSGDRQLPKHVQFAPITEATDHRFAFIAPLPLMQSWRKWKLRHDNYWLLLAHKILEDPTGWGEYFAGSDAFSTPLSQFVMMDNSLIELGYPLPSKELAEAAQIVSADALVLPDVMYDGLGTTELAIEAARRIRESGELSAAVGLMAVVQGHSYEEIGRCALDIKAALEDDLRYWCVPRCLTNDPELRSRVVVCKWLRSKWPEMPIHLLGFSDNLSDDFRCAQMDGVMGIDSAMPIWLGQQGHLLPPTPPRAGHNKYGSRPKMFWEFERVEMDMINNVWTCRRWVRGEQSWIGGSSRNYAY